LQGHADRPFDLAAAPAFRAVVVRLDDADHMLMLVAHHIVTDAQSHATLFADLSAPYAAACDGVPASLVAAIDIMPATEHAELAAWNATPEDRGSPCVCANAARVSESCSTAVLETALDGRPPALEQTDVHVWRAQAAEQPADAQTWALLGPDEVARAGRFRRPGDRERFVIAHALVRTVLASYLGTAARQLRFDTGRWGKPFVVVPHGAPPLRYNLSHTDDAIVLAVARRTVGVDVECWSNDIAYDELAAIVFSPAERRELARARGAAKQRAFFTGWTRKEAYLKATGRGLSAGLDHFDVSLDPASRTPLLDDRLEPRSPQRWTMRDLTVEPGYSASLVVAGTGDHEHVREMRVLPGAIAWMR
jgi:4'-phosphopantetheinyl transferase